MGRIYCFISTNSISSHYQKWKDIVCPEAVKIDDLDLTAVSANFESAKTKLANAQPGSAEAAEFMIEVEVNRAMGYALGISLA